MIIQTWLTGRPGRWHPSKFGRCEPGRAPHILVTATDAAVDVVMSLRGVCAVDAGGLAGDNGTDDPLAARLRVLSLATEVDGHDTAYILDLRRMDRARVAVAFRERAAELGVPRLRMIGIGANRLDPAVTVNLTGWSRSQSTRYEPLLDWVDLALADGVLRLGSPGHAGLAPLADLALRRLGISEPSWLVRPPSLDSGADLSSHHRAAFAGRAVATLWLADALRTELDAEGLAATASLEYRARAVLQSMTIHGLPFDLQSWTEQARSTTIRVERLLGALAELTGGGNSTLFGTTEPDWNPASPADVRRILNTWCPELVGAFLDHRESGGPRALTASDRLDKQHLGLMAAFGRRRGFDTRLIEALAEHAAASKATAGAAANLADALGPDGRFHPEYTQCVIETGRTSSRSPNVHGFTAAMRRHVRPPARTASVDGAVVRRVLVYGDYSQAELRVSAQLTGEPVRRRAFATGIDQHEAVAAQMFGVDMVALRASGPAGTREYASLRNRVKAINYGIGYGMSVQLLADTLTVGGTPTTHAEAAAVMARFDAGLPKEAAWFTARDTRIREAAAAVRSGSNQIDFPATWQLHTTWQRGDHASASRGEIGNPLFDSAIDASRPIGPDLSCGNGLTAPVLITRSGLPWQIESRTTGGRRRLFQIRTAAWLRTLAIAAARHRNNRVTSAADRAAAHVGIHIADTAGTRRIPRSRAALEKELENPGDRDYFVARLLSVLGAGMLRESLMRQAAAECVEQLANAYRNAPVQGTIADAVLLALAELNEVLAHFPNAFPVITVHDSIAVECDATDAPALLPRMRRAMEEALAHFCPDVAIAADVEIKSALAEDSAPTSAPEPLPPR